MNIIMNSIDILTFAKEDRDIKYILMNINELTSKEKCSYWKVA